MSFLHPALAWAAIGAVALPIVIHLLFRRRRVPVDWAAMELLREAIRRTNRRLRFEQWIVLLLRALAVLAAGLAIAVPILGDAPFESAREKVWIVVVDNGATSALKSGAESELVQLREETLAAIRGSRVPGDRFAIVTAANEPTVVLTPTADFAEFERALTRVESVETPTDLAAALRVAREIADDGDGSIRARRIFVASSFRRGSLRDGETLGVNAVENNGMQSDGRSTQSSDLKPAGIASDSSTTPMDVIALVPVVDMPTDVRIDRVETRALPSGGAILVRAVLSREGSNLEAAETRVRVEGAFINAVATRVVAWNAGQSESTVEFQVVPRDVGSDAKESRREIVVSIDDDVLAVGNTAYAVVDIRRDIEVAVVGRRTSLDGADLDKVPGSLWIARALMPGLGVRNGIRIREIDPASCDSRALLGVNVVVVARPDLLSPSSCDVVGAFVREGGVAIVIPNGESLAQTWGQTLFTRLGVAMRIATEARDLETPLTLREEQPASLLLSSIVPELPALCAPIEVRRAVTFDGVTGAEAILTFVDGSPFVAAQAPRIDVTAQAEVVADSLRTPTTTDRGLVVCLAASPELSWTNLPVKPLMVPLFQEIVRTGVDLASASDEVLVGDRLQGVRNGIYQRTDVDRSAIALEVNDQGISDSVVPSAGVWSSDEGVLIAANVRSASIALVPNSREAIRSAFLPLGGVRFTERANSMDTQSEMELTSRAESWSKLWSLLLLALALVLFFAEGVLSRIFSHASLARASGPDVGISTVGRVRARTGSALRPNQEALSTRGRDERVGIGGAP
jgi:hypothetical protein